MDIRSFLESRGFNLRRQIGSGAFSKVYKAIQIKDGQDVAIKVISMANLGQSRVASCLKEIQVLSQINHPLIVKYFDSFFDSENNRLFIVTEYLGGGDLSRHVQRLKDDKQTLPEEVIWRFALQAFLAMRWLHDQCVVHRDIKPANLFLSRDLRNIKVGDLNTCTKVDQHQMTKTITGTPNYLAPEVYGNKGYNKKCDVFSMGCVIYEMAALKKTFPGDSMDSISKKIRNGFYDPLSSRYSRELNVLVSCCLIMDFRKRPSFKGLLEMKVIRDKIKMFDDIRSIKVNAPKITWEKLTIPSDLRDFERIFQRIKSRSIRPNKFDLKQADSKTFLSKSKIQTFTHPKNNASIKNQSIQNQSKETSKNIFPDLEDIMFADSKLNKSGSNIIKNNVSSKKTLPVHKRFQRSKTGGDVNNKRKIDFSKFMGRDNPLNSGFSQNQPRSRQNCASVFPTKSLKTLRVESFSKLSESKITEVSKSIKSFGRLKASNSPDQAVIYYNLYQEHLQDSRSRSKNRKKSKCHIQGSPNDTNHKRQSMFSNFSLSNRETRLNRIKAIKEKNLTLNGTQAKSSRKKKKLPLPMFGMQAKPLTDQGNLLKNLVSMENSLNKYDGMSLPSPTSNQKKSSKGINKLFVNQYFHKNQNHQHSKGKIFKIILKISR